MKKVYIDLGHGGTDSGAVGVNNVLEKNIVLEVGKKVELKLKKCGIDVRMSRTTDIFKSLEYRSSDANKWGADCFVSIHCNSFNQIAKGIETYCYKFKYRQLADCVHSEMVNAKLYTLNRGVKEGNLYVVRKTNMAACLVELGFIDNVEDINFLLNKQEEFAIAIAKGICKFLGLAWKESSESSIEGFKSGEYDGRKARVTASELNVRYDRWVDGVSEPAKIGKLKKGDIVNLGYCLKGWVGLHGFKGNKGFGYVNSKYLELI
ncbi:Sporulation-specific N-acetylmuramoyl-L-alanine amidase [uncultured Clostridium sp.]|nr:Sporulation-specific N-acetylmuramoyl-L-alanine amidase [uncultured Clostridium sp.]SCI95184.1 Sporulation-specific N-acetylmuramoyl-L-alanine amidase [uncultured Clostridium sp.]